MLVAYIFHVISSSQVRQPSPSFSLYVTLHKSCRSDSLGTMFRRPDGSESLLHAAQLISNSSPSSCSLLQWHWEGILWTLSVSRNSWDLCILNFLSLPPRRKVCQFWGNCCIGINFVYETCRVHQDHQCLRSVMLSYGMWKTTLHFRGNSWCNHSSRLWLQPFTQFFSTI